MARLPEKFLEWNYYSRRRLIKQVLEGKIKDTARFFLEFTRHNPVLCTAAQREDGLIEVNGKVVGIGYVVKEKYLGEKIRVFKEHIALSDAQYSEVKDNRDALRKLFEEHSRRGLRLLLEHIYLEPEEAENVVDFEKLTTIELAARIPHSSKHTWSIVQRNKTACIVFFQPPSTSFELKGRLTIHLDDRYHSFVTLIHDSYHYTPPERRGGRPVYIFHVEEVYDNSPTPQGYGRKLA